MVADEHEARGHEKSVGGEGVTHEALGSAPEAHHDQDCAKGEQSPDFHTDTGGEKIWDEAVFGDSEFDALRGKAEAAEEAEQEGCCLGGGLESGPPL